MRGFMAQLALWLWFTVLFANFAEAVAEGRGKAQADSLRKARKDTIARRLRNGAKRKSPRRLAEGRSRRVRSGDVIPADGEVIEGIASVDEVGDYRRIRARHSRKRRRPQRRHGRARAS